MSAKRRLADAVILPTKEELDERAARAQEWERVLSRMLGYSHTLRNLKGGFTPLEYWRERYVDGEIDFDTFEAGLAERLA